MAMVLLYPDVIQLPRDNFHNNCLVLLAVDMVLFRPFSGQGRQQDWPRKREQHRSRYIRCRNVQVLRPSSTT